MDQFLPHIPLLAQGLGLTLQIFLSSLALAMSVALVAGTIRYAGPIWLRWPVTGCVEFFRGTSCFVQLFWCFYALPLFGVKLSPFMTSVVVLGINLGSFGSEVVRSALSAVPPGQLEAARALNYSPLRAFLHIQLPQAMQIAIRPAANLMVDLLKLTPVTSLVTVNELTRNAMVMRTQTGSTMTTLLCIFVIYFLLASIIYFVMNRVEAHCFGRSAPKAPSTKIGAPA